MSKLSQKSDEINVSYPCKYIIQSYETFIYFIDLPHNYAIFRKIRQNEN